MGEWWSTVFFYHYQKDEKLFLSIYFAGYNRESTLFTTHSTIYPDRSMGSKIDIVKF